MLDSEPAKLTRFGVVSVGHRKAPLVRISNGFQGDGCTCRDVSALALVWAIGELQRELMATLERPGGGNTGIV